MDAADALPSWNDTPTRAAVVDFVSGVTEGPGALPPEERVASFDNDGTLWCEKPLPVELAFIMERLAEMAEHDATLRSRQPWQAAYEKDLAWLGDTMTRHYEGDDTGVKLLMGGVLAAFAGWTVEDYVAGADAYVRDTRHPVLGRPYGECGYVPMVELLRFLEARGFTVYIASGGNRDFMRGFAASLYGIPPERVIGSSNALTYQDTDGGTLVYRDTPDVFDDGPAKPVRIWSRVGRRPVLAGGNANGDLPMLRFAGGPGRPALRLVVAHDDPDREPAYTAGAERVLEAARSQEGWAVVSVRDDWSRVFAGG